MSHDIEYLADIAFNLKVEAVMAMHAGLPDIFGFVILLRA